MSKNKKRVVKQIKNLQTYLGHLQDEDMTDLFEVNHALAAQSDKVNASNSEWIIDNGATHHIIGNYRLFREYRLSAGNESFSCR